MFPGSLFALLLSTAFCACVVEAVEPTTTADLDTRVTTQPPPPPSPQAVSLQWLLDNVDNMIADLESCCCQDKVPPVNTSVSVATQDTTEIINTVDKTAPTSKSPQYTSSVPKDVATVPDGQWCYTCNNTNTNEACNEGELVKCQSGQESCHTELRYSNGAARISKGCRQLQACESNTAGNSNICPDQNGQSYCVYCCQGYGCNKYLPANPVDVGTKSPDEASTTSMVKSTTVVTLPPSPTTPPVTTSVEPPTISPVTPSVELGSFTAIIDTMESLLPKLQSCCCETGSTTSHDKVVTSSPDIDVTLTSSHADGMTTAPGGLTKSKEDTTEGVTAIKMPTPTPPVITTTPVVKWDDQRETLTSILDLLTNIMPKVTSCCCDDVTSTTTTGLWCYTCNSANTNEECNEGELVKCQSNQESCHTELRYSNNAARISKGCRQLQACQNNAAGNRNNCPDQNGQSYCVYCCQGYGCNKYLPANPAHIGTKPPVQVPPTTPKVKSTTVVTLPPSTKPPVTTSVEPPATPPVTTRVEPPTTPPVTTRV
ncbi:hypothetical protein NP493_3328g00000, partial [Ridgeia piscesae]